MQRVLSLWLRWKHRGSPRGQTLVEYTLILGMISVLALAVFSALGNRVVIIFSAITSLLDTAQAP